MNTMRKLHGTEAIMRGTIVKYMDCAGMTKDQTAMALGMSRNTFNGRLNAPGTFSMTEIGTLIERLHIPADELFAGYLK